MEMDVNTILIAALIVVFVIVGVALVVLLVELVKTMRKVQGSIEKVDPTLTNVEIITDSIKPAIAKVDPLMDRVTLTMDSVNLEMMRVDKILESVGDVADSASSAAGAVESITNAPLKAVTNVSTKVKSAFGGRDASVESAQLAEQRAAVARALKEYELAEAKGDAAPALEPAQAPAEETAPIAQPAAQATAPMAAAPAADDDLKTYVEMKPGSDEELVIDPHVIAESSFFDDGTDAE